jgi:signal transduction histidine kinase
VTADLVPLLHLVGFITGIVLYAMLGAMTFRQRPRALSLDDEHAMRMPLAAAVLGMVWNIGSLVIYGLSDFQIGRPSPVFVAIAFTALGFLPAVVVDSAVRPRSLGIAGRAVTILAYVLSAAGGALHLMASVTGAAPSRAGLLTLTIGYGAVLALLLVLTARALPDWRRALFVVALAAFSVSALHLSGDVEQARGTPSESWFGALVGHHASLPLVLVILYQDYRFAFADLFLRRALLLLALVSLAVSLHVFVAVPFVGPIEDGTRTGLLAAGVHVALWVTTALCYPVLRRGTSWFVDRVVLQRADNRQLRARVASKIDAALGLEEILDHACAALGPALSARRVSWSYDRVVSPASQPVVITTLEGTRVLVPTADSPRVAIEVGALAGGRRLLSDDIALLEAIALAVARRIDVVRVTDERYARDLREREILQLATEAELRALRAQLNPHFLFNALTTIGYLVQTAPQRAVTTVYRLSDLLRAVLRRSSADWVTVQDEIEIVEAYLAIERARFEERLEVSIDVPNELRPFRIPTLLLQPLVENAIKHGVSPLKRGGRIIVGGRVEAAVVDDAGVDARQTGQRLHLWVSDTGVGIDEKAGSWREAPGVGLRNIERRLQTHFGKAASLRVQGRPGQGTTVELTLPAVA